jgi:hypothetical protein
VSRVRILPAPPKEEAGPGEAGRLRRLGSADGHRGAGWARRRVARPRPRDAARTDAWSPGPPAAEPTGGDAVPTVPERAHLRHARPDGRRIPRRPPSCRRREDGSPSPDRPASTGSPSRPRVRCAVGAQDRRPVQACRPSRALTTTVPSAAAETRNRATTHGAHRGNAIGSRRDRSGSISPSHSSTRRTSRCGIRRVSDEGPRPLSVAGPQGRLTRCRR